jgi:hypothetical protein
MYNKLRREVVIQPLFFSDSRFSFPLVNFLFHECLIYYKASSPVPVV